MAFKNFLLYSAALLSSIASAAPVGCQAVRVISVRGTNEVYGASSLLAIYGAIAAAVPGTVLQGTPYPAIMDDSNWSVYGGSVTAGVGSLQGIIKSAVDACPQMKIVLLGYSQGANVVGDALCSSTVTGMAPLAPNYADNIAAVAMFGDPTHINGQPFMIGGATRNGMVPRTSNSVCAPYTNKIASFCHPNDPVCDTGDDISQHLNYSPELGAEVAQFVASKL